MKTPARYILLFFLLFTTNLCLARSAFTEAQYPYIVNMVKIPGFVTGLVSAKSTPNILFAIVQPDGKLKLHEKYGIYIFDIKDPLKPQHIGYYSINSPKDSGAGRGCDYTYFDLLNNEKDNIVFGKKRELLMEMQDMQEEKYIRSRFPVPRCSGNTTGWFIHNNTVYYESKYKTLTPINEGQEFHAVSYIKNGKINKVCEYEFEPVVHVNQ